MHYWKSFGWRWGLAVVHSNCDIDAGPFLNALAGKYDKMNRSLHKLIAATLIAATSVVSMAGRANADDAIPYPNSGSYNPASYSFTAQASGDLIAYFAGSTAGYDNQLGLLVNGVDTGIYGLDDHTSFIGQQLDFGHVNAGDSLVFVLDVLSLGDKVYSDPSMNVAFDSVGVTGHNHIYSTAYTGNPSLGGGIPNGTYVAFEDLRFPGSDFNYHDENFVFAGVPIGTSVPEPSSLALAGLGGIGALIAALRRRRIAA
jgi:hypothetical protein